MGKMPCLLARARKLLRAITVAVDPLAVVMLAADQGRVEKTLTTSSRAFASPLSTKMLS